MKALLSHPLVYLMFQRLVGAESLRKRVVEDYLRAKPGDRILDIGCGTGDILTHLPAVDYVGFDLSPEYIRYAQDKFAGRGRFYCQDVAQASRTDADTFDIVLAMGVLHHLSDEEAHKLLALARRTLRNGGRLVTIDPCFTPDQSTVARYLISSDRGQHLRNQEAFVRLVRPAFSDIQSNIRHDGLRIPYTHLIMEMRKTEH